MEKNNELDMGLFGSGNELEIDLNFDQQDLIEDLEDKTGDNPNLAPTGDSEDGEGTSNPEEQNNPSDEAEPQETVAKEGGDESGDESDKSSPNIYNSLAAVLKEQGLLSTTENSSITDADELVSAFKEEIKKSEYADLSKEQREYLDAIRDGVPSEMYNQHRSEEVNLEKITTDDIESNAELRRRIIYQDLVNQGLSEDNAIKFTNRSVENGSDLEDAQGALPNIKAYNKAQYDKEVATIKQQTLDKQKEVEKGKKALKDAIMDPETIFDSYKPTANFKESVYKNMNTVVGYNDTGAPENALMKYRRENPVEFDAKLYYLFSLTNGFNDLNKFKESGTSSAVNDLERTLMNSQFAPSGGKPSFIEDPNSYSSGFGDEIVID